MRAETKKIVTAFLSHKPAKGKRTHTDGASLWLHDNRIARHDDNGICMTMCGWGSPTTRERLNGICDMFVGHRHFHQKNHEQFYGDQPIGTRDVIHVLPLNLMNETQIKHLLAID